MQAEEQNDDSDLDYEKGNRSFKIKQTYDGFIYLYFYVIAGVNLIPREKWFKSDKCMFIQG